MGQIAGITEIEVSGLGDLSKTIRLISKSEDLHSACLLVEDYFSRGEIDLLTVSFCDLMGEHPSIRPFMQYPDTLVQLSLQLRDRGGCPVINEAKWLRHPFDALQIDKSRYPDFLGQRFLAEFGKLEHRHIPVIPVMLGRGLAVFSTGFREREYTDEALVSLVSTICQITVAIIGRFPEVTKLFEPELLSTIEAEMLLFNSYGCNASEIGSQFDLSEFTVNIILDSAATKLDARNRSQAITRAIALGEISNMQLGKYALI